MNATQEDADTILTITLSERAPVRINTHSWPLIASAYDHDGGRIECQALETVSFMVRAHADGRRLVYGWARSGPGGSRQNFRAREAGYLLTSKEASDPQATVRAIWRVAGVVGWEAAASECVASLPAEEI